MNARPGEGNADSLTFRIINLPLWYCDDKHFNRMLCRLLGEELWRKVDFTSLPKHFERKENGKPYNSGFGAITFTDVDAAAR
eukprot:13608606-Alexandrium_andersonii.AAC.1